MKRKILPVFAIGIMGILTVVMLLFVELYSVPTGFEFAKPVRITIPKGASIRQISEILQKEDMIEEGWQFEAAARIFRIDRRIRAGNYSFDKPLSPIDLAKALTTGGNFDIMVPFPEGSTIFDIARIASDSVGVDSLEFLRLCFDRAMLDSFEIPGPSCEGYLFPETYSFPEGISPREMILRMHKQFKRVWDTLMFKRAKELGFSLNDVVTLSSIVEAEAHVAWEQPVIASVYENRLRRGMLLQADPTVRYALKSFGRPLTRSDLDSCSSEYNTYRHKGLPPGPICNPGLGAISAVLWPDSTDYLYFVSNEDGTHWFTRTLIEHNAAIEAIRGKKAHGPLPKIYIDHRLAVKDTSQ